MDDDVFSNGCTARWRFRATVGHGPSRANLGRRPVWRFRFAGLPAAILREDGLSPGVSRASFFCGVRRHSPLLRPHKTVSQAN